MAMMYPSNNADYNRMTVLVDEIRILKSRISDSYPNLDLYTTISVLNGRIEELEKKYNNELCTFEK